MCKLYTVQPGLFINTAPKAWLMAMDTSMPDGKNVHRASPASMTITDPSGKTLSLTGSELKYMFFGSDNYLLVLDAQWDGTKTSVTYYVSQIDFTVSPPVRHLLFMASADNTVDPPMVTWSQGTGSAFLVYSKQKNAAGTLFMNIGIYRGDNGSILCSAVPFSPDPLTADPIFGKVVLPLIELHTKTGSYQNPTDLISSAPVPAGNCKVTPSGTFPPFIVGGDPNQSSADFVIANPKGTDGGNCLSITSVTSADPFFFDSTVPAVPAVLDPDGKLTVKVFFRPGSKGSYTKNLDIVPKPGKGDTTLACTATAKDPVKKITFDTNTLSFGKIPVGTTRSKTVKITNTGDVPVTISIAAPANPDPFSWAAYSGSLAKNAQYSFTVTFTPSIKFTYQEPVTITSDIPTSNIINLEGTGCRADPSIVPDPVITLDFGSIERGFRSVRYITVRNPGEGKLLFHARIAGSAPGSVLFGLPPSSGSVTDVKPWGDYTIDPVTPCGAGSAGSGECIVAVAFYANDNPNPNITADLIIEAHNAPDVTTASWTYGLKAAIIATAAVDAALVLDRTGSMADPAGERTKSAAVIAGGQLFMQLFRPDIGDRITVVSFNEHPNIIRPMSEITTADQAIMVGEINSTNLNPQGWTAIASGIMKAHDEMTKTASSQPNPSKCMVVLTDGNDNRAYLNPADNKYYSIMGGMVESPTGGQVMTDPLPPLQGIKVYGIGVGRSENIDNGRLDVISSGSGGYFGAVGTDMTGKSYFDLEKYFTQIYMHIAGQAVIKDPVFSILPGEIQTLGFTLLRGDVGALVVVYDRDNVRLPFYLVSPTGEMILWNQVPAGYQIRTGMTVTARFMEIRVPAGSPDRYAGDWKVVITNATGGGTISEKSVVTHRDEPVDYGIAISAGSNFRMQPYLTPGIVHTGDPLLVSAVISEAGLPVTGCTVTVEAKSPAGKIWTFSLDDSGVTSDGDPGDGEYAYVFDHTGEGGSYDFTFRATGKSRDDEMVFREAVLSKYIEGRIAIGPVTGTNEKPGTAGTACCRQILLLGKIGIILLVIIILILLFRFRGI
jgi:hypothetical protein